MSQPLAGLRRAGLDRRNGWTIAEHAGEVSPDGAQRLLLRAEFDVDGVRDDLRDLVVAHLANPDAVLVIVTAASSVHGGVQGRDRRVVPAGRPHGGARSRRISI